MTMAKKRVGIVSYNMYGNFTNYGSALQTYALQTALRKIAGGSVEPVVMDYCPDCLADKDILNPVSNMWDKDPEARERCRLTLPAIKINYEKFKRFYLDNYNLSVRKYTSANFNDSLSAESLDGYVCGSDTIFAVPEFGFDDGFYANYDVMRHRSVAYAASFGDFEIDPGLIPELSSRLANFNAIALRENDKLPLVRSLAECPVYKVIDPTLLLTPEDYSPITALPSPSEPYLLLYSRRGDARMQTFAERIAGENSLKIVEISLNARNSDRHTMRYDAGVEEFLGLVRNAAMVVTNSFHGMIFAVQFRKPFYIFSRKLCDTKIEEVLDLFGIKDRMLSTGEEKPADMIDYDSVHDRIESARRESLGILESEILNHIG